MLKKKGFTLIELLVVIAIIALLLSILMPALSKVRKQAKSVACQANLKQWALVFNMYTGDNGGLFPNHIGLSHDYLRAYYRDDKLLLCPMATKPYTEGARPPFGAHYYYDGLASYGHNTWILSEPKAQFQVEARMWKTPNVAGAAEIPLVMDCLGYQNASPWHKDEAPEYDGQFVQDSSLNEMRYVCITRHGRETNMAFVDFSVRPAGLKELWELQWSRLWYYNDPENPPVWPEWMKGMKEYSRLMR